MRRAGGVLLLALVLAGCGSSPDLSVSCKVHNEPHASGLIVTVRANRGAGRAIVYGPALQHVLFVHPPLQTVSVLVRSYGHATGSFPGWILPRVAPSHPGRVFFVVARIGRVVLASRRTVVSDVSRSPDCTSPAGL